MDNDKEQNAQLLQKVDHAQQEVEDRLRAEQAINIANDYLSASVYTTNVSINGRIDILKDYASAGLAITAALVVLLTIEPKIKIELIKTSALFYIGSSLILFALLLVFVIRRKLVIYLQKDAFRSTGEYNRVVSAARVYIANSNEQAFKDEFQKQLEAPSVPLIVLTKLEEHGDKYAGLILLIGTLCIVTSLLFKITT